MRKPAVVEFSEGLSGPTDSQIWEAIDKLGLREKVQNAAKKHNIDPIHIAKGAIRRLLSK